jgi:hypothetical protein
MQISEIYAKALAEGLTHQKAFESAYGISEYKWTENALDAGVEEELISDLLNTYRKKAQEIADANREFYLWKPPQIIDLSSRNKDAEVGVVQGEQTDNDKWDVLFDKEPTPTTIDPKPDTEDWNEQITDSIDATETISTEDQLQQYSRSIWEWYIRDAESKGSDEALQEAKRRMDLLMSDDKSRNEMLMLDNIPDHLAESVKNSPLYDSLNPSTVSVAH